MFSKKASVAAEVYADFEKNYEDQKTLEVREAQAKFARAVESLVKAADLLDDVGLDSFADEVSDILETVAWHVPTSDSATSGLTPEKMEKNLAEKGWVFNADDGEILEVAEAPSDESVPQLNDKDGTIEVEDEDEDEVEETQEVKKEVSEVSKQASILLKKKAITDPSLVNELIDETSIEKKIASNDLLKKSDYDAALKAEYPQVFTQNKEMNGYDGALKAEYPNAFKPKKQLDYDGALKVEHPELFKKKNPAAVGVSSSTLGENLGTQKDFGAADDGERQPEWLSVIQDFEDDEFSDPEGLGLAMDNETDLAHKMKVGPYDWKPIGEMSDKELEDHADSILRMEDERADVELTELSDEDQLDEDNEPIETEDKILKKIRRLHEEKSSGPDWEEHLPPMFRLDE